jgi:hypothetical protein
MGVVVLCDAGEFCVRKERAEEWKIVGNCGVVHVCAGRESGREVVC